MSKENFINWLIKFLKADTNKISDGYHTFEQLYEHRIELWILVCKSRKELAWKTRIYSDGSEWKGWFVLGLNWKHGKQITYHLPMKYWGRLKSIQHLNRAPNFDGHTPNDVIFRLKNI